jgi:hypothetical protein
MFIGKETISEIALRCLRQAAEELDFNQIAFECNANNSDILVACQTETIKRYLFKVTFHNKRYSFARICINSNSGYAGTHFQIPNENSLIDQYPCIVASGLICSVDYEGWRCISPKHLRKIIPEIKKILDKQPMNWRFNIMNDNTFYRLLQHGWRVAAGLDVDEAKERIRKELQFLSNKLSKSEWIELYDESIVNSIMHS